jgi:lysophospholipase L1-like esterase
VVTLDRLLAGTSPQLLQPDGKHFTAEGHRALAARVLPKVIAHIGGR